METIPLAVFGLHLTDQSLNHQLTDLGATFLRADFTAAEYRLYAITNSGPAKPGAVRVTDGTGGAIALELWEIPVANLGYFTRQIPLPLGIGTVKLADVCCFATVIAANDRGFNALVLEDCVASYSPERHSAALETISAQGGIFGSVSGSVALLDGMKNGDG